MIILTIRTDKPESELGLYGDDQQLDYIVWEAHRKLAETINQKVDTLLGQNNMSLADIQAIVVFKGPGSFTGLRIGISVANALAYSLNIPIVGETGAWIEAGIDRLRNGSKDPFVLPEYGQPVHITEQKK